MGDADGEILVLEEQDVESWMDEALDAVDEGLEFLLMYMININSRTKEIMLNLKELDIYRLLLIAMNVSMIPVIISVLMSYYTNNMFQNIGYESWLKTVISALMFVSGGIGLPLYLFFVWQSYRFYQKLKIDKANIRRWAPNLNSIQLNFNRDFSADDSFLTLHSSEETTPEEQDILSRFDRMLAILPAAHDENIPRENLIQQNEEEVEVPIIHGVINLNSENFSAEIEDSSKKDPELINPGGMKSLGIQSGMDIPAANQLNFFDPLNSKQDVKQVKESFGNSDSMPSNSQSNLAGLCSLEKDFKSIKEQLECLELITASMST